MSFTTKFRNLHILLAASFSIIVGNGFAQSDTPCNGGGAPALTVNSTCTFTTGTTVGASEQTNAANFGTPACGLMGQDVWYSFVAPASGSVVISTAAGGVTDGVMALYESDCAGTTTELACSDDVNGLMPEITQGGLTPGQTYYIRFWEYGGDNNGTFDICIYDNVVVPNIPPGGIPIATGTVNSCTGTFYDTGGLNDYSASEDIEMTLCPNAAGQAIVLNFTDFDVEGTVAGDVFCVYDGLDILAPSLGCYSNDAPLTGVVAANNPTGCVTVWFQSTASIQMGGWAADISCQLLCQDVIAAPTFSPAPAADGIIYLCQGDALQMNGDALYPGNGVGYVQSNGTSTFEWAYQDGANQFGQNFNHTFNNEGAYLVQLEVTDIEGCDNDNDIDQFVYVSTTPIFAGSFGTPDPICAGDQAVMTGVVNPVLYEVLCTPPTFPPLALPDGSGVSYETDVNLDCYLPGQTLTDVNDLLDICVTMEHSYMGDLNIVIECPNGTQVTLVDYGNNNGGNTFLGVPVDDDLQPAVQGTGFSYCWSPNSVNGTWSVESAAVTTLPAGTYASEDPLAGLVGCPMNGDWTIIITDNLNSDNGFIFDWGINFDPSIISPLTTFTPTIVSTGWQVDPTIVGGTANPITVEPTAAGNACYVFEVTDDFSCSYDTTVCIVVNLSPIIDPIADITSCGDVTLPGITGTDLTGNQAFFTGPLGTGTQYNPGQVLTGPLNLTLYIFDEMLIAPFCDDEESFTVIITPLDIDAGLDQVLCTGGPAITIGADPVTTVEGATYTWTSAAGTGTIDLSGGGQDNGQVTVSPAVTTTYTLTISVPGCVLVEDITITVDAPPTASNPANINVQCAGDVPAANVNVVTTEADDITIPPAVTFVGDVSDGLTCPETITRTYRVTDGCGNFVDVVQLIIIDDTQIPVMNAAPGVLAVQCSGDVPAMANLGWTDNCDGAGTVAGNEVSDGASCPETITRTWTYTDACGNAAATATQTITVNDTQVPVFAAQPADVAVQCAGDVPAMTDLGWTDNCDGAANVTGTDGALIGGPCGGTITRTWTYTDACGNNATVTQTITVDDTTLPTATNPAPQVGVPPVFDPTQVTDEADNCSVPTVTDGGDVSDGGNCPEIITRTYIITDACGNTISVTQTFTIGDAVLPTASDPTAVNVECIGDVPATDPTVVTDEADNGALPTVTWEDDTSDGLTCPETITRRYRVTDDCGNFIFVEQTITVNDVTIPVMDAPPAALAVQCAGDVPSMTDLGYTDNCDPAGAVTGADVSDGLSCPETITRSWTFTDACGNVGATVTQTITVQDTQAPVIAGTPAAIAVQCIGDVPAMIDLNYTDNCDVNGTVTGADVSDGASCPETITRTWTFTDACGNNATETQTITVNDTQVPVFAAPPANVTVECTGDVPAMTDLGWTDNCDGAANVTGTDGALIGGPCGGTITRTWTYTDACGNNATVTQTITVDDTTLPTATNPAPQVGVPPVFDPTQVTDEADNCSVPTVTDGGDVSDGGSCPEIITRTYIITDACGNTISVTQTFTIGDLILPTASDPAAVNVECIGDVPAIDPTVVTDEADNGALPTVTWEDDTSDGLSCPETITRRYRVTDDCGNFIFAEQTITVNDVTAPVMDAPPAALAVQCVGDVPTMTDLGYTDNCDPAGTVTGADVSDGLSCPETITRSWTFTDACGNVAATVTQTITVQDTQAPVMTPAPADLAVQCPGDVPAMADLAYTDNCDAAGSAIGVEVTDGLTCPETITRTWTFTDACGNNATEIQTITVQDTQAPVMTTAPADLAVQCIGDVPAMADLPYTDNCDAAGNAIGVEVSDGLTCPETITRTWTFTDACGNNATETQTITVQDTQVPVFAAPPADLTVECVGDVPAMTDLGWTDNCDGAANVTGVDGALTDPCGGTITRTWTYTDACGNNATVTQTITVDDTTLPTATNPVTTIAPGGPAPAVDITVVIDEADNCTVNPVVAFVSEVSDNNPCPETITRIYSVTDDCGNTINVTHIILITDPFLPTATNPLPINVECIGDVPAPDVLVVTDEADNQGIPVVAFVSDLSDGFTCPETITRTYSVTDLCGGQITVDQTITVLDITLPVMNAPLAAVAVQCIGDVPAMTDLGYTDNCDAAGVVTGADVSDGLTCPETITRSWFYTDACGNVSATVTQTITVQDTQVPVIAGTPAAIAVQCIGDVPAMVDLGYTDNCDAPGTITGADVSDGLTCPETITRTWTFTDACGNNATETQTITVQDTQVPVFAAPPADLTVECIGDVPAMTNLGWTDNCDGAGDVNGADGALIGGACGGTITRTWTFTDACGNNATVTQTITVDDTTLPTASNPVTTIAPGGPIPVVDITVVIDEADNCTVNPVVAFVSEVSDNNPCPETITRIYSVTDDCGNTINVTHLIIITDPILPTGTPPAAVNVECIGDVPAANPLLILDEADNQGVPVVAFVGDVSDGLSCPETITRTYSITDVCGNVVLVTQLITVLDITNPTATAPATVNVECIGDVPVQDILDVNDEADNCTVNPVVVFVGDVSDGLNCPETITRTYSITDDCGNQITVDQLIIVNDVTNPTGTAPATVNVECIGDVPAQNILDITTESDNCTVNPVVVFVSDVSDGLTCPETITRTYSITDDCGNQITVDQLIIVNDVTLPTASNPATTTVPGGPIPAVDITVVIDEADNCTVNPVVAFVSEVSDNNPCPETITRIYSVTDDCGNTINVTHLIVITDPILPTGTAPATVNVECIGDVPANDPLLIIDEADNQGVPVVAFV
jgi:subtilisin-like proprotein convertase family protein